MIGAAVNAKKINVAGFFRKKIKIFHFECNFFRKNKFSSAKNYSGNMNSIMNNKFNQENEIWQQKWVPDCILPSGRFVQNCELLAHILQKLFN